ncbi:MAG: caspase family protein [Elusimicrobia bacterium]|nr:caspase family protein [Elusimicrobiota bacterium]
MRYAATALALLLAGCATPMQKALLHNDTAKVRRMLAAGVDVNEKSKTEVAQGGTALHFAAALGEDQMVRILVDAGADLASLDKYGRTPFEIAKAMRNPEIAKYLKEQELKRSSPPAAAPAADAPPSGVVGREEIAKIVAAALAAREKAKTPAPVRSDVDAPSYKLAERPDDFALVVGVEKYMGLPDASFARRDAEAVRDHLLALGYPQRNVVLLTDSQATKTNLTKYLEAWLPESVGPRSTVFVYYSGHGAPDAASGQAYLVPVEGDPQYLAVSAFPLDQFYRALAALKAKRVVVALDSCFSGAGGRSVLAKGTRPLVAKVDTGPLDPGGRLVALTASASDEISGTIDAQGHGAFTYYLLKGLNGAAAGKDGAVTLQGLYDYLKPKVADAAREQNRDQTPALIPEGGEHGRARLR